MRILLVEDDDRIAEPLAEDLRHQSNAVDIACVGIPLELTSKEYMLLEYFLQHPTQVISRTALLDRLWELLW